MTRKFHILLICMLLATISCTQYEHEEVFDNRIHFTPAKVDQQAAPNANGYFQEGQSFGIYGARYTDLTQQTALFTNTPVTLFGGVWQYSPLQVWLEGYTYRFRAFYPYTDFATTPLYLAQNAFGDVDSYHIYNYVVSEQVTQQIDLMVSDVATRGPIGVEPSAADIAPVDLTFNHLLTKINIHLKKAVDFPTDVHVVRLNVKFFGMKTMGDCQSGVWDTQSAQPNATGYSETFGDGTTEVFTQPLLKVWPTGLYMIQQFPMQVKLKIVFFVKRADGTVAPHDRVLPIPADKQWMPGKEITYTATIENDMNIRFLVPKVEQWAVSKSNNSVIIR